MTEPTYQVDNTGPRPVNIRGLRLKQGLNTIPQSLVKIVREAKHPHLNVIEIKEAKELQKKRTEELVKKAKERDKRNRPNAQRNPQDASTQDSPKTASKAPTG